MTWGGRSSRGWRPSTQTTLAGPSLLLLRRKRKSIHLDKAQLRLGRLMFRSCIYRGRMEKAQQSLTQFQAIQGKCMRRRRLRWPKRMRAASRRAGAPARHICLSRQRVEGNETSCHGWSTSLKSKLVKCHQMLPVISGIAIPSSQRLGGIRSFQGKAEDRCIQTLYQRSSDSRTALRGSRGSMVS